MEKTVKLTSQTGYLLLIKRTRKSRWTFVLLHGSIVFARKTCVTNVPFSTLIIWLTYRNNVPTGQERLRMDLNSDDLRNIEAAISGLNAGYLPKAKKFRTRAKLSDGGVLTLSLICRSASNFMWKIAFQKDKCPGQQEDHYFQLTHVGFDALSTFYEWLNGRIHDNALSSFLEIAQKNLLRTLYFDKIMFRYHVWRGSQE